MSKTTIRKRIALTATTALFAGVLSFVASPQVNAALSASNLTIANQAAAAATADGTWLLVAEQKSTTGAVILPTWGVAVMSGTARSLGILSKDTSTDTAQTATILAGGGLALYTNATTDVAFTTSGGTFSGAFGATNVAGSYSNDVKSVFIDNSDGSNITATGVAVKWTAPSTAGTYTISMDYSTSTNQLAIGDYSGSLGAAITVTVVASSAGGSYSAAYSLCNTRSAAAGHGAATGIDTTSAYTNGQTAYIAFDLDDVYDVALDAGNIVVSATGGGLVELAANGSTAAAGSASTKVTYAIPSDYMVQVVQGTANAPMTSTVTITFNGTTVCTKTISIRGEVAKLEIGNIATGDINSTNSINPGANTWMAEQLGVIDRAGLFTVVAKDSAGNTVVTNSGGSFAVDSATLTTTVQALSVGTTATSISTSTDAFAGYGFGTWTCGAAAGSSSMKLKWTNSGTGTVVTSDAFTARCADDPYTYTASWDKAAYTAGEIATLTVQFLDSKGNKANNVGAHGEASITSPMFTAVTGSGSSGSVSNKADGTRVYTRTVGLSTGITAGTYSSIIEYASLVAGTKQTPSYKVSTGQDTTTNADVLKSIVALIASINKQIQALQKLILKK